ncbi:MAG: THxN family PEP-CTERM protein [Lyngbya sp. HA4199-MV5]|nr:THxN family PEP-CTERM protein [Lyngbya sp. HA4199-MV5]
MQAISTVLVKSLQIIVLTLSFNLLATTVRAFTFSTIGTWNNAIGGNVTYTSGAESQASWGQFVPQSGLGFTGRAGTGTFGSLLSLGQLKHFNNPVGFIELTVPQTVDLTVALNLLINDEPIVRNFTYSLRVDETPDDVLPCPYPSTSPCADAVFWENTSSSNSFAVGGVDYTLELLGFSNTPALFPINQFISEERSTNETSLFGRVVPAAGVPEPTTTTGLLLAGLGLAYARRRFKKRA